MYVCVYIYIYMHITVLCTDRPFQSTLCVSVHLAFLRVRMSISVCSWAVFLDLLMEPGVAMINQLCKKDAKTLQFDASGFLGPHLSACPNRCHGEKRWEKPWKTRLADEAFLLRVQRIKISASKLSPKNKPDLTWNPTMTRFPMGKSSVEILWGLILKSRGLW